MDMGGDWDGGEVETGGEVFGRFLVELNFS